MFTKLSTKYVRLLCSNLGTCLTFRLLQHKTARGLKKRKENTFAYLSDEKYLVNQRIHLLFITLSKMGLAEKTACYLDTWVFYVVGKRGKIEEELWKVRCCSLYNTK